VVRGIGSVFDLGAARSAGLSTSLWHQKRLFSAMAIQTIVAARTIEITMGWLATIALAIVLLALGLYALLGVAIIVTALVERRPVKSLAPAEPSDPEWQRLGAIDVGRGSSGLSESESNPYTAPGASPYVESQIGAAARLGFTAPRLFKYVKGGIYKTRSVLTISPSQQILAVIRWGSTASIRNEATVLFSALEDGRYLVTSDRPSGSRTPGLYDDLVFLKADWDQLVRRHEERVRACRQNIRRLSPENPLAEYEAILERRARFLVEHGDAYWVDQEQTEYRSTLKGALKFYAQSFSTKHVDRSLIAAESRVRTA
jgi:hypothetical protein